MSNQTLFYYRRELISPEGVATSLATLRSHLDRALIYHVKSMPLGYEKLDISSEHLEQCRRLCSSFNALDRKHPVKFTSHRPIIGKFIVLLKKAIYPILEHIMRSQVAAQNEFNFQAVKTVLELSTAVKK